MNEKDIQKQLKKYDYQFKIIVMGDEGSKTGFITRYCYNLFNPSERLMIGVDFHFKTVELNNKKIQLQIWDVGREERFRFLLPTYCSGADGGFFLYDITRPSTLDNMSEWMTIVRQRSGPIPIMLVGSKIELSKSSRQVPRDYGIQIAEKNHMASFVEISAKENINVDEAFKVLTELILVKRHSQDINENPNPPELVKKDNKEKSNFKSPIPEDSKEKNVTNEDRSMEEKLNAFGDMVEKVMQIILKIPELFDNSLQDLNSKVTNLQSQLTTINRDISPLGSPRSPPLRTLETLREQLRELENVKKCPNCSDVIKNDNIKICEKCGSELINERKTNFENFMSNFIEDMQLEIEKQQTYIKKLEKELKIKTNRKEFKPPRTEWVDPHQEDESRVLRKQDAPRIPRKGNWGYGYKLNPWDDWDGILY
jgi:small GTP-binding protein